MSGTLLGCHSQTPKPGRLGLGDNDGKPIAGQYREVISDD